MQNKGQQQLIKCYDSMAGPGDPYPFEGKTNPFAQYLQQKGFARNESPVDEQYLDRLWRGTTSVEAADKEGWVVSVTPSGGWLPLLHCR
jgi:gamma-glutamyltranspeptidase/glutathione hydrolase